MIDPRPIIYGPSPLAFKDVFEPDPWRVRDWRWLGFARTYSEVAALLHDTRPDAAEKLSRECSESPTAFYVKR